MYAWRTMHWLIRQLEGKTAQMVGWEGGGGGCSETPAQNHSENLHVTAPPPSLIQQNTVFVIQQQNSISRIH